MLSLGEDTHDLQLARTVSNCRAIPTEPAMTSPSTDPGFEVETLLPDGVRYVLPVRQLGQLRTLGLTLSLISLGCFLGGAYVMYSTITEIMEPGGDGWIAVGGLIPVVPLWLGSGLFYAFGQFLRRGQNIITLRGGVLTTTERAGMFHKSWQRDAADISGLSTYDAPVKVNGQPVKSGPLAEFGFIKVDSSNPRPLILAAGYPQSLCAALAKDLGERLDTTVEAVEEPWEFDTARPKNVLPGTPLTQPADSDVAFDAFEDGVTLKIPPAGSKGTKGIFGFAAVWCTLMSIFTGFFVFVGLANEEMPEPGEMLIFIPLVSVFWLVGILMMLSAVSMARRSAVLAVVDDTLMVLQTGLFKSKRREWTRDEIESIRFASSGTSVNKVPVMELQIHPHAGKKVGLLSSRPNDELRWIVDVLTRALRLGPETTEDQVDRPANSNDRR